MLEARQAELLHEGGCLLARTEAVAEKLAALGARFREKYLEGGPRT